MIQGGGKWPRRLSSICKRLVEESNAFDWTTHVIQRIAINGGSLSFVPEIVCIMDHNGDECGRG